MSDSQTSSSLAHALRAVQCSELWAGVNLPAASVVTTIHPLLGGNAVAFFDQKRTEEPPTSNPNHQPVASE
eukprot:2386602-Karenia_brevis.AAC.1